MHERQNQAGGSALRVSCRARRTNWLLVLAVAIGLSAGACAHRAAPRALPQPPPSAAGATSEARAIVAGALALLGTPYRNGGRTPSGFDCSGFVQYLFAQQGMSLPRSVREQWQIGGPVARDELAPGDLVFFSTVARGASHVGIVVADDLFVHAPSGRGVVRTERLSEGYWAARYVGARRIGKDEGKREK
jgi:cell wall-associated NlpC family hydrolase